MQAMSHLEGHAPEEEAAESPGLEGCGSGAPTAVGGRGWGGRGGAREEGGRWGLITKVQWQDGRPRWGSSEHSRGKPVLHRVPAQ